MAVFHEKHGVLIQEMIESVHQMIQGRDGDSLLLFRKYLECMINNIDEGMGAGTTRKKAVDN